MHLSAYEKVEKLGSGSYGSVYKYINDYGIKYAVKEEDYNNGITCTAIREITSYSMINHPNILKLHWYEIRNNKSYLIYDLCDYNLDNYIKKINISYSVRKKIIFNIVKGLKYLHDKNIIHRDLKPSNILINKNNSVKIGDLGSSKLFIDSKRIKYTQKISTSWFRSPEIFLGLGEYNKKVDIWSLGCIIYYVFHKNYLFNGNSEIDVLKKIFRLLGTPNTKTWKDIDKLPYCNYLTLIHNDDNKLSSIISSDIPDYNLFVDLISKCLIYNPDERSNIDEIYNHPYFNEYDKIDIKDISLQKLPVDIKLNQKNRKIIIDWYLDIINDKKYNLNPEVYYFSILLFDEYLELTQKKYDYKQYQLISASCILLSSKIFTLSDLKIKDLEDLCCYLYNEQMFLAMETDIIKTINWSLLTIDRVNIINKYIDNKSVLSLFFLYHILPDYTKYSNEEIINICQCCIKNDYSEKWIKENIKLKHKIDIMIS